MATATKPSTGGPPKDEFRQIERRIRFGLLFAFFILLGAISLYFQLQFQYTIKETGRRNLAAIAESQRNTVDLFLQERVFNILGLFHSDVFSTEPTDLQMHAYLTTLQQASEAFIDVGFLNEKGRQIGYAGPFPQLYLREYGDQLWFTALLGHNQDHYISDIYLGFRQKPHFTIGVKHTIQGQTVILRATLDPDKFYQFLRTIHRGRGSESMIINRAGIYQVVDPRYADLFTASEYLPPSEPVSDAIEAKLSGERMLLAYAWLKEADWALIISEPISVAYAGMLRARRIMFGSSALIILAVIVALWLTSKMLIGKAREQAAKKEEMYMQLVHAGKMASLGELATGVAHEINNPLAIIMATTGVIKDRLNPEFQMDCSPSTIGEDLGVIDAAVIRARGITQQLLNYGRKNKPQLVSTDVNNVILEVLGGYKARELELANIEVLHRLDPNLPQTMADPDQFRQVFFNLLNNAGDAINGPGRITITSAYSASGELTVAIADSGCGMDENRMARIFDPFFTTKEVGKGTGLGLSVSLAIIESFGGTIRVKSSPGVGSIFEIVLPVHSPQGGEDEFRTFASEKQPAQSAAG